MVVERRRRYTVVVREAACSGAALFSVLFLRDSRTGLPRRAVLGRLLSCAPSPVRGALERRISSVEMRRALGTKSAGEQRFRLRLVLVRYVSAPHGWRARSTVPRSEENEENPSNPI